MAILTDTRADTSEQIATRFAAELALTAVERDERGGTALSEREALRRTGLLNLLIPRAWGGLGAAWPEVYRSIRILSRADSSIGHLFGFQHLMLATIDLFGSAVQKESLYRRTAEGCWFWGNTLNPLDPGVQARWEGDQLVLNGRKGFSTGSTDADALIVSAPDPDHQDGQLLVAAVPLPRSGIEPQNDWNAMGQRQTDSGTVQFRDVHIDRNELLRSPGPFGSTRASLRPVIAQLIFANVYLGIAEGALEEAKAYLQAEPGAWWRSGVATKQQDPYVLRHFGELFLALEAARLVTDRAAESVQAAWEAGDLITTDERGLAAVHVAEAKAFNTRNGLEVVNRIFEVMGARSTTRRRGIDRFWRNLRTYTLHDPVDYKLRELGDWVLNDNAPAPTFYS